MDHSGWMFNLYVEVIPISVVRRSELWWRKRSQFRREEGQRKNFNVTPADGKCLFAGIVRADFRYVTTA